jgi:hypothetical protein
MEENKITELQINWMKMRALDSSAITNVYF